MNYEVLPINLLLNDNRRVVGELKIYEESPEFTDLVLLELFFSNRVIRKNDDNLFSALLALRHDLEREAIQIMCNGAAMNVYPSPMQLSMGSGRTAHLLRLGQQTKKEDIVDIFACNENLTFVSIDEQFNFNSEWINSIRKNNFI